MLPITQNILLSLVVVFSWSLSDVLAKYFIDVQEVNPQLFTFYKFLGAAFVLIIISGKPNLRRDIKHLKNPYTWIYVSLMIVVNVLYAISLKSITATEAALLIQAQIILHAIVAYIFMRRKQAWQTFPGHLAVLAATTYVAYSLPETQQHSVGLVFMALTVLFCVARTVTAEIHPEVSKKLSFSERCKTTGYISFATSILLLGVMFMAATANLSLAPETLAVVPLLQDVPTFAELTSWMTILSGVLSGVFVVSVGMYVFFYVNHRFGAENFAIVMAFQPAINFLLESLGAAHLGMSIHEISGKDILAGCTIILAALYMLWVKSSSDRSQQKSDKQQRLEDHFEIASKTYDFCNQDIELSAEKLGLEVEEIQAVLNGEGAIGFDLPQSGLDRLERHYRRNVAEADYLTGLVTRSSLLNAMNGALSRKEDFSLIYLDLNNFKPINDTFGHDAGDTVLKAISKRMMSTAPAKSIVCRLGGDEFAIMLRTTLEPSSPSAVQLIQELKALIELPIQVEGMPAPAHISASFGFAESSAASTARDIIKHADTEMYREKG